MRGYWLSSRASLSWNFHHGNWLPGQAVRLPGDRHLPLFHRLQQRRLRLRGGAVDFVNQDDLREHRAGPELEVRGLLVEHRNAGDITWKQVGSELQTPEAGAHRTGDALGEGGLANPGHVLNEQMALAQQRDYRKLNLGPLAHDNLLNVGHNPIDNAVGPSFQVALLSHHSTSRRSDHYRYSRGVQSVPAVANAVQPVRILIVRRGFSSRNHRTRR